MKNKEFHFDTELENWFIVKLVDFFDDEEQILSGIVKLDHKGRFKKGRYVLTSPIVKIIDGEYVHTLNSIYKIDKNKGEYITLPYNSNVMLALRSGYSPLAIQHAITKEMIH